MCDQFYGPDQWFKRPRRIVILQNMRLVSTRVPGKMLAVVGKTRLVDRGLSKLLEVCRLTGATPLACICPSDVELIQAASVAGVSVFPRTQESRDNEAYDTLYRDYASRLQDNFDWAITVNICCRPFLRVDTMVKMVEQAKVSTTPFIACYRSRGLVWNDAGTPVIGGGETADTTANPYFLTPAHLGYGMPVNYLDSEARLSADVRPWPVDLTPEERIDIDTPEDLDFAQSYASGLGKVIHEELR